MPNSLETNSNKLNARWRTISDYLKLIVHDSMHSPKLNADYVNNQCWVGLVGGNCEMTNRHRGSGMTVPIHDIDSSTFAWLGFQEVWNQIGDSRIYIFKSIGMTLYIGMPGQLNKSQILRIEWPGYCDWRGNGSEYQTADAATPHWQVDIANDLYLTNSDDPESAFDGKTRDFMEFSKAVDRPLSERFTLERMHLGSSANWWVTDEAPHVNLPNSLNDLNRWTIGCLRYLKQELARCVLR